MRTHTTLVVALPHPGVIMAASGEVAIVLDDERRLIALQMPNGRLQRELLWSSQVRREVGDVEVFL